MLPNPEYDSFLIRLWRGPAASPQPERSGRLTPRDPRTRTGLNFGDTRRPVAPVAETEWLIQVENIPSGEQQYFASLEDLFAFIRRKAASSQPLAAGRISAPEIVKDGYGG